MPSPEKPKLQAQKYDPGVFVQVALAWHRLLVVHSLISKSYKHELITLSFQFQLRLKAARVTTTDVLGSRELIQFANLKIGSTFSVRENQNNRKKHTTCCKALTNSVLLRFMHQK